jgi:type I restriction enzyme M protein
MAKQHPIIKFANIKNADALGSDIELGRFTLLLVNPPFGTVVREGLDQYELARGKTSQRSEILFIERCLSLLKPGGRMGMVVPDNVLTNPPLQYVRDYIKRNAKILAIVSLPTSAFVASGTAVKTHLLFLEKTKASGYGVFMGNPDKVSDLPEVLTNYHEQVGIMDRGTQQ